MRAAEWLDYDEFATTLKHGQRFAPTPYVQQILHVLQETSVARVRVVAPGAQYWRAQRGCIEEYASTGTNIGVIGHKPYVVDRMFPNVEHIRTGGRANPAGVAYLYLSDSETTAVAEVRPWVGSYVTVASLRTRRELRLLDLTPDRAMPSAAARLSVSDDDWPTAEYVAARVWWRLCWAFAEPVDPDSEELEYLPTQYLAEFFNRLNFDGLVYASALAEGKNVLLYDVGDAEIQTRSVVQLSSVLWNMRRVEAFKG